MAINKTTGQFIPLFLGLFFYAIFSHYYFWQVGDDSYIYYRYAERLANGQWWSWTDHLAPVEGFSSPLWYFLLGFLGKAGFAVDYAARYLGLFFSFGALIGSWYLTRILNGSHLLAGFTVLVLSLNEGFHYWSTAGLETSLYAALMVWSAIGIIRERYWLLPTALLGLARPEGPFLLLAVLIAIAIVKRQRIHPGFLLLAALPTLFWLGVRLHVYELPLPNTFYAKATGHKFAQVLRGILYGLPALLPLLLAWFLWLRKRESEPVMIALGMSSMLLGIVVLGGGDWMIHFRLLVSLLPVLLPPVLVTLAQVKMPWKIFGFGTFIFLGLIIVSPIHWLPALKGEKLNERYFQEGTMTHRSIELVEKIEQKYQGQKLLVAVNHAGVIPWAMPDHDFIDMVGLNDAHIARSEGGLHEKNDPDYVLSSKPDLIVLNSRTKPGKDGVWYHKGYWHGEDRLVEHALFENYRPTDLVIDWYWQIPFPYNLLFPDAPHGGWILVYERID